MTEVTVGHLFTFAPENCDLLQSGRDRQADLQMEFAHCVKREYIPGRDRQAGTKCRERGSTSKFLYLCHSFTARCAPLLF